MILQKKLQNFLSGKDKTGKIYYDAELLDKNKHSVLIVKLEEVKCLDL